MRSATLLAGLAALSAPLHVAAQASTQADPSQLESPMVRETQLELEDGTAIRFAVSLPSGFDGASDDPRPLVLALHPGGRSAYYGSWFLQTTVEPALRSWGAVMVAPDVPDRSWTTERSERALLTLLEHAFETYDIDRDRVLVTGFSMGGRGTWHVAAKHPDVFTGAIVMAGSPEGVDVHALSATPLYLIHSPDDEVVPFQPVQEAHADLLGLGYPIRLQALPGASHHDMGSYDQALREAGAWILERWLEAEP